MVHIAICDDRPEHLERIAAACRSYFDRNDTFKAEIITFDRPVPFLEELERRGGCDIALLDICMPGISGIEVSKEIRARQDKTEIIFLTTSNEFAVEAFDVGAIHYLLKPFSAGDFDGAMDRAMKRIASARGKKIKINGEGGALYTVNVQDILYVESFRNGRSIHTAEGVYTETKRTLAALQEELETLYPRQFVSPYRGYIINFAAVFSITKDGVTLKNGVSIPIKPDSFRKLRASYFEFEFSEE